MVDRVNSNPPSQGPHGSDGPEKTPSPPAFQGGKWHAKPMTWLGMKFNSDEASKLWSVIVQNISSAISKDKDKAIKALKKLRADHQDNE